MKATHIIIPIKGNEKLLKETGFDKFHKIDLDTHNEYLELVRASCEEALDGSWDCTTPEGIESFEPMIDLLNECIIEI
jgi:hypothetical protein